MRILAWAMSLSRVARNAAGLVKFWTRSAATGMHGRSSSAGPRSARPLRRRQALASAEVLAGGEDVFSTGRIIPGEHLGPVQQIEYAAQTGPARHLGIAKIYLLRKNGTHGFPGLGS